MDLLQNKKYYYKNSNKKKIINFYFRPANFSFAPLILLSPRKIYFHLTNFTFAPQNLLSLRKFYFGLANFTFAPQMRFAENICNFRVYFRGQKVAISVKCGIKMIVSLIKSGQVFLTIITLYRHFTPAISIKIHFTSP